MMVVKIICVNCGIMLAGSLIPGAGARRALAVDGRQGAQRYAVQRYAM
jgi:hypothetical protein